ncbi:phylloquinone omega-hydroxylase CYP4F2-like [Pomacea canaliculata]|uniref:phylloquinone omega-hydroxylase CYP4F2-like n=1 Tax=Pomacea canaliculata TaxID=400727 RepID=UPI000D7353F4|nr:phylloquinone omega-hydroxylase CYP4F2-like [Pomacea canaliculata]
MVAIAASALSVAALVFIVFWIIKFLMAVKDYSRTCYLIRQFPHEPSHPIWGHLFDYPGPNEKGLQYQREMTAKYPRASSVWLGPSIPVIFVSHPDTVKLILKTSEPKAQRFYHLLEPWIGDGLLLSKGRKWGRNRRLLTPAFHFDILKPYLGIKNTAADVLLDNIGVHAEKDEYFEVFSVISKFALDVILKCAFSYDTDCQKIGNQNPYVQAVYALSEMAVQRYFQPWFHSDWLYFLTPMGRKFRENCRVVHKLANDVISKRKITLASTTVRKQEVKKNCLDFLDILLTARDENGEGLTFDEIKAEVDTFLFGGHGTTASAISWAMYSLAQHADIQATCQEEIDELFKGRETDDFLWEDLSHLPYLSMCIKEALRLHSPVPSILRELTQDTDIDGHIAPKGAIVNIVIYNIHHNPTVWQDSLEFRPERFTEENIKSRNPYAFIPFSAGPRNCIGQNFAMDEMKLVLAKILHRFTLVADPDHKVEKVESLVMKAKTGIQLKAIPRKQA